jgi:uncharacterized damage-inducible protein DinB
MATLSISRPAADEAADLYHRYIARVSQTNIAEQLAEQLGELDSLVRPLEENDGLRRYAPGKWSIKELLGHLADAERIFSYRLLRISRGDTTPLPGFDENAYVPPGEFDSRPLRELMEDFRAVRQSTIRLVESTPASAWSRRGEASGKQISARALAYILVGHVTHHMGVMRERYGLGGSAGGERTRLTQRAE